MRLRIDIPAEKKRRLASVAHRVVGPVVGCAAGFLVGGLFGSLAGTIIGTLLGELFRRSGVSGSLQKYLADPDTRPGGPPFDEAFPGSSVLAGFVAGFDPGSELGSELGGKAEKAGAVDGFERVAVTRIALEGRGGLEKDQLNAFSRLAQSLLASAASYSAARLITCYFAQAADDPLPGAICAWALFKRHWPNPERRELTAMRSFLSRSGCPEETDGAAETALFPERAADWELLGLRPGASREEIKKSFRALSIAFHPDGLGGIEPEKRKEAEEAFRRVRTAYERLSGGKEEKV
jgi:hypothetical protein